MKLQHLLSIQSPWLKFTDDDTDIILSTWVNLSRNIKNFPFINTISKKDREVLRTLIIEKIESQLKTYKFDKILLDEVEPEDLLLLKERHLIERTNAAFVEAAALFHTTSESKSILINGFDHIRMQIAHHGLACKTLWEQITHLDDELMQIFQYAYKDQFGFLTTSMFQAGTGLKVEILMHLPVSVFTGKINQKIHQLNSEGISVKHFFDESDLPIGNLFVLSNQKTIGMTESEIIDKLENAAIQLSLEEKTLRDNLFQSNKEEMLDKIHRSFGLLSNSYRISFQEAYTYLSILKIGIDTKVIEFITQNQWCRLFQLVLPAHIQVERDEKATKEIIDEIRSGILSKKLKSLEKQT